MTPIHLGDSDATMVMVHNHLFDFTCTWQSTSLQRGSNSAKLFLWSGTSQCCILLELLKRIVNTIQCQKTQKKHEGIDVILLVVASI